VSMKPLIRLIKKGQRRGPETQTGLGAAIGPNKWSGAVRLWVSEFQQQRRGESLPSFGSLFKDTLP
jgi:hypothetical protein